MESKMGLYVTLIENSSNIYFYLFSIPNYKTEPNRMHNGHSGDHIAGDLIHTDTTRNIYWTTIEVPPWNGQ